MDGLSRDVLQSIIDCLEDAIVVVDRRYRILQANAAMRRSSLVRASPVVGKLCHAVICGPLRLERSSQCPAREAFATGRSVRATYECRGEARASWHDLLAFPLCSPDGGHPDRVIEIWRDVSEDMSGGAPALRPVEGIAGLHLISALGTQPFSLTKILDNALEQVVEILGADAGGIYLVEPHQGEDVLRLRAYRSISWQVAEDIDYLRLGEGFSGRVVESGVSLIVEDVRTDPRLTRKLLGTQEKLQSMLVVPLRSGRNVIGTVWVAARRPVSVTVEMERQWLETVAGQLTLVIENARLYETVCAHDRERLQLLARVIQAQEEERKRIARDLHDQTNQELTALKYRVEHLLAAVPAGQRSLRTELEYLAAGIDRVLEDIRQVILDLRPGVLDDLGLVPAIKWYAAMTLEPLGVAVRFDVSGAPLRLTGEQEITFFRVMQEAVNNIAQHAQPSRVDICIQFTPSLLTARVEDDGRGFDVKKGAELSSSRHGVGLLGIRERLTLVGGSLELDSAPGRGTRLRMEMPVAGAGQETGPA